MLLQCLHVPQSPCTGLYQGYLAPFRIMYGSLLAGMTSDYEQLGLPCDRDATACTWPPAPREEGSCTLTLKNEQ